VEHLIIKGIYYFNLNYYEKVVILVFITVLFVSACSTEQGINDGLNNVKVYKIEPVEGKFFQWDELVDKIEVIKLEMTEKSLIGQLSSGFIDKNNIYIHDRRFYSLLHFDNAGKFIRSVGLKGRGPGEYLEARDFCVSDSNVYILDYQKIHSYNREDDAYIESWALPGEREFNSMDLFIYNKDMYFLWSSNPDSYGTGEGYYRMREVSGGKIKSKYFKYDYRSFDDKRFYLCSDSSAYIMPVEGEYTVYKLTGDSVYASFVLDFGKYAISPQKADILRNSKERNAYFRSDFYKHISTVLETADYIYFICIGPARTYEGLISKKTGKVKFGKWDYAKSPRFFFSDGVYLYGYYESHVLIGRKSSENDLNTCFDPVFDGLKDIKDDDNPVLVKVLLKDML
jgi:hypothetical protein